MQDGKRGIVLVRDATSDHWNQRLMEFDPSQGRLYLIDQSRSEVTVYTIRDRLEFRVKPSQYMLTQYPTAMALHVGPLMDQSGYQTDLHITSLAREDMLQWSYYLNNWAASPAQASAESHSSVIGNLSEREERYSESLLNPDGVDLNTVLIDKFNIPVTYKTLQCLRDGEWLSDEVVNFYFSLIQEKSVSEGKKIFCWNSFFYSKLTSSGYNGVRNWTNRRNIDLFDLNQVEVVLIPVHVVDHWALGVVDMKDKSTTYLDSLGSDSIEFHSIARSYLQAEFAEKHKGKAMDWSQWSRRPPPKSLPLQTNGSDCGVFICMYALAIASGYDLNAVNDGRVPVMRRRIAYSMAKGRIKKWPSPNSE